MRTVVVYAKAPRPGRVKRRLSPPLERGEAAEIYRLSLSIVIDQVQALSVDSAQIWAYDAEDKQLLQKDFLPSSFPLNVQKGGHLGERLCHTAATVLKQNGPPVLIIGSDAPTLPIDYLRQALDLLERNDAVLGPTEDGGYYAIGLRRVDPMLFQSVSWGCETTFAETASNLEKLGWSYGILPQWYDIDRFEDLRKVLCDLRSIDSKTPVQEELERSIQGVLVKGEENRDGTER